MAKPDAHWRRLAEMELHQIRYFIALAQHLNFTRAAERCGVTQPAFTKAIQKLESALGGELICRERNLSHLTHLGRHVLPLLEKSALAAEKAGELALKIQRQKISSIRVALSVSISATLVAAPLRETAERFAGLQIELLECSRQADLFDLLLAGEADVGIGGGSLEHVSDRIDHWLLFEEEFVLLMNASDPLARFQTINVEQLCNSSWLVQNGCEIPDEFRRLAADGSVAVTCRGGRFEHLQHMVTAGLGIMLIPRHYPHIGSVSARPIAGGPIRRRVRLFAVAGRRQALPLRTFIGKLRHIDWDSASATPRSQLPPAFAQNV
jgi:DNA-binding transcriptional LysR family regulator